MFSSLKLYDVVNFRFRQGDVLGESPRLQEDIISEVGETL